jgi:hypothetical protein
VGTIAIETIFLVMKKYELNNLLFTDVMFLSDISSGSLSICRIQNFGGTKE